MVPTPVQQAAQMKAFSAKLTAVLGGSGNGNGNSPVSAKALSRKEGNGKQAITLHHQSTVKARIHKALPGPEKKEKAKVAELKALKAEEVRPDQGVPLEEGEFKEF